MKISFSSLVIQSLSRVVQFFFHKERLTIWFCIVAVVFFWKPVSVLGQETVVTPTITVTERYESNPRFREGQDDDWEASTVVSPEITFTTSYPKSDLNGSIGANIEYYPSDTDLNNESYHASLGFNFNQSPKTTYTITESFSFSQDSLSFDQDVDSDQDFDSNTDIGIQVERSDIMSNRLGFSVNHRVRSGVSIGLSLSDSRTEYDSELLNDTRSFSISPFVDYGKALEIGPRTTLTTGYDYTQYYLESDGDDKTSDTHSLSVGIDHRFTPDFSISGSVGAVYSSESGFDYGFIGDISLSKSTRKSEISLTYSRSVDVTPYTNDLNISQRVSVLLATELAQNVSSSLNAGVRSTESETSDDVDVISYNSGVNVSWQAYSWMSVSGGYSYFEQESDGTVGNDLSRNTVFVSIRFVPAVWRF